MRRYATVAARARADGSSLQGGWRKAHALVDALTGQPRHATLPASEHARPRVTPRDPAAGSGPSVDPERPPHGAASTHHSAEGQKASGPRMHSSNRHLARSIRPGAHAARAAGPTRSRGPSSLSSLCQRSRRAWGKLSPVNSGTINSDRPWLLPGLGHTVTWPPSRVTTVAMRQPSSNYTFQRFHQYK